MPRSRTGRSYGILQPPVMPLGPEPTPFGPEEWGATSARLSAGSHAAGGIAWWPLSAVVRWPASSGSASVLVAWLATSALSVVLAVAEARFGWSAVPVSIGAVTISVSVYPPVVLSVLIAFWLGPTFGAVTAYVSGLASGLSGGLAFAQAVFFALGTPAGVLLLWFLVLILRVRPNLPAFRDWWRFAAVSFVAITAASLAVMLYNEWHRLPLTVGQRVRQGWVLGDAGLLCFVAAPLLRFTWRRVHDWVSVRIGTPNYELSPTNTVLLLALVWTTLTGVALLGLRLMASALDMAPGAVGADGELLLPRIREMATFLVALVGALLLSTMTLTAELTSRHRRSLALSLRDELTGALNRRAFRGLFDREAERSRGFARPISLVYFDLDEFKAVNDRYGHRVGDAVLVAVTREAQALLRPRDLLFRWGGDEFVVLLPDADRDEALAVATQLRERVEARVTAFEGDRSPTMTVSVGLATMRAEEASESLLIDAADNAVRWAKRMGKNRVATDVMTEPTGVEGRSADRPAPPTQPIHGTTSAHAARGHSA